jgi:ribosomal protein L11 methyltransferase
MWYQLSVVTDEASAERVGEALSVSGAVSVSLQDAENQPLFEPKPGETPVWRRTRVIGLFADTADVEAVRTELRSHFSDETGDWNVETLEDRAWERVWLDHFQPFRYGRRLWICPTGFEVSDSDGVVVMLDPGLAFGTGTHPTTALCLEWLDAQPLHRTRIIDYGCGSGILGIAALALGSAQVEAVDIDPQALLATRENARKNGVEARIRCSLPSDLGPGHADVVLANILANPLIDLAEDLGSRVRPNGRLVLSGILAEQAGGVLDAYRRRFDFGPVIEREGWVRLDGCRRG